MPLSRAALAVRVVSAFAVRIRVLEWASRLRRAILQPGTTAMSMRVQRTINARIARRKERDLHYRALCDGGRARICAGAFQIRVSSDYHRRIRAMLAELPRSRRRSRQSVTGCVRYEADRRTSLCGKFRSRMDRQAHKPDFRRSLDPTRFLAKSLRRWNYHQTNSFVKRAVAARGVLQRVQRRRCAATTRSMHALHRRSHAAHRSDSARARSFIGDWVWGCDICQDVCPPTQRAGTSERCIRAVRCEAPDAVKYRCYRYEVENLSDVFAQTAMGWRGAAVLRRNAAIALGNALDEARCPRLVRH